MEWIAGGAIAAVFSTALLAMPAVLAVRWLMRRRREAPLERGTVERNFVLASAVIGGIGAVAWSDAIAHALVDVQLASILLGFVAPIPLASVSWVAGEALSGPSERPWLSLLASAAASSVAGWLAYAICWKDAHTFVPAMALIQLSAAIAGGLTSAHMYLTTRGQQRAQLPAEAVELLELDQ
jgi:hypothetical protein